MRVLNKTLVLSGLLILAVGCTDFSPENLDTLTDVTSVDDSVLVDADSGTLDTGWDPGFDDLDGYQPDDGQELDLHEVIDLIEDTNISDATDTAMDADTPMDILRDSDVADVVKDVPLASTVGERCYDDEDCNDGRCVYWGTGNEKTLKICTGPCDDGCPYGMLCIPVERIGANYVNECVPFLDGLCTPCTYASNCPQVGSQCVEMSGGGKFCTIPCADTDPECPTGFVCEIQESSEIPTQYKRQCVPLVGTCECNELTTDTLFDCDIENESGLCTGQMQCVPGSGWSPCPVTLPEEELCDSFDNNCNGATDEGFSVVDWDGAVKYIGKTCGTGLCRGGRVACNTETSAICSTVNLARTEDCGDGIGNSIDDDCDGETDENCVPDDIDGDGFANDEDCWPLDADKYPGAYEPCCPAGQGIDICDYNCNKVIDLDCTIHDADYDGYDVITPEGGDDCNDSDPTVHPGAKEKCNDGIDQDCNGADLVCCAPGETGCTGPIDVDGDGFVGKNDCNDNNPNINPWAKEKCNYIDDDCNGIIDDGLPGGAVSTLEEPSGWAQGGAECGNGSGLCEVGTWVCMHFPPSGFSMECLGGKRPGTEICDGQDNDCDGSTDETFEDLGNVCDGSDFDKCPNGTWVCNQQGTGIECEEPAHLRDMVEVCGNGIDDDCNGQTDDACWPTDLDGDNYESDRDCNDTRAEIHPNASKEPCCDPNLYGELALIVCDWNCDDKITYCQDLDKDLDGHLPNSVGGGDCDDNNYNINPNAPEKCGDGIDQNCDGKDTPCSQVVDTDGDGYSPPGDCNDSNRYIYPTAPEICNDQDDDCDGVVDDSNPGGNGEACGSSVGECLPGEYVCVHYIYSVEVKCVPMQAPEADLCDGKDNNCNGSTDEYFPNLSDPCDGPDSDLCENGRYECLSDGTGTFCGDEAIKNIVELCNGIDNDCDGETDENFLFDGLDLGERCNGTGECGNGWVVCSMDGSRATCSTNWDGSDSEAVKETCDGLDNDCDGVTDDDQLYGGQGVGRLCRGVGTCGIGTVECNPATLAAVCSVNPNGSDPQDEPESCDGKDNDCDGHIDEEVAASVFDCKNKGVCDGSIIPAECVKGAWECDYTVVVGYEGPDETSCDGEDNNCDGGVDEAFELGQVCDGLDMDKCGNGTWTCRPDTFGVECVNETITNIAEMCNQIDDDCDGVTDENYAIGELCDGADSDMCRNGSFTCKPDGTAVECINEDDIDIVERCNGLDDDCDGATDEDFALGVACDGPDDDLCANGHTACNVAGDDVMCVDDVSGTPTDEVCDDLDNDCDGSTDEGFTYKGLALEQECDGIGECGGGVVACRVDTTGATCSTNPDGPTPANQPELCDELDNDCDGATDEDLNWQGVALGQGCVMPGQCGAGTVVCSPTDLTVTCSTAPNGTEPGNSIETCDALDNDCNDITDDIPTNDKSGCKTAGFCAPAQVIATCTMGEWTCDYSQVPGYVDGAEVRCDGLDENCDGDPDETWPLGEACDGADFDKCANGTWTCKGDATGAQCVNESVTNIAEECGNGDEDCDGKADEEGAVGCEFFYYDSDRDTWGISGNRKCLCISGAVEFYDTTSVGDCDDASAQIYPGHAESCNYMDDDCDSYTDEDAAFNDLGGPCDSDEDGCALGQWACTADGAGLECGGDGARAEACNGVDDDCNGFTDESWPVGEACDGGDSDMCANGTWTCRTDTSDVECMDETVVNISEMCNGLDDDCDGSTDETWPVGAACDGADTDMCRQGTYTCRVDKLGVACTNEPVPPSPSTTEVCDNKDNDCNGTTDDPWPLRGTKCDAVASSIACETGLNVCNVTKNGLTCLLETECAPGSTCYDSGTAGLQDQCTCGGVAGCTTQVATVCTAGQCKCGDTAACQYGKCEEISAGVWGCQ